VSLHQAEIGGKTMTASIRLPTGLACLIAFCLLTGVLSAAQFAGGTGAPNDPYQIATAEQLISIGSDPNLLDKHFVLLNDIDLDPNLPGGQVFTRPLIAPDRPSLPSPGGTGGGRTKDAPRRASRFSAGRSRERSSVGANSAGASGGVRILSGSGMRVYAAASLRANRGFTGSLDGRGHCIRKMTFQKGQGPAGLFGYISKGALVSDLGIEDVNVPDGAAEAGALAVSNEGRLLRCHAQGHVSSPSSTGLLVGTNKGEIIECWADGAVSGGQVGGLVGLNSGAIINSHAACSVLPHDPASWTERYGGGLVGWNEGAIINCYATGTVCAQSGGYLGGLVGKSYGGTIAQSYATGDVSTGDTYGTTYDRLGSSRKGAYGLGGLVGEAYADISDCYATGNVSGGKNSHGLGGLVGTANGHIVNSYSTGRVCADANSTGLGGLVGLVLYEDCEIRNCFWDVETSGLWESAGGTGLTTALMQDMRVFLNAGWDWAGERANCTADLWYIPEGGGYPALTVLSPAFLRRELSGTGTPEDPYLLASAEDLGAVNHYDVTACYKLVANIDLEGMVWKQAPIRYFSGTLDGAGMVVRGLEIQGDNGLGLFRGLSEHASVVNLGIRDADITGETCLGALAGFNSGSITACYANGVVSGTGMVGCLTGANSGSITDSYATGVAGLYNTLWGLGGLAGRNCGVIRHCYAAAILSWLRNDPSTPPGGLTTQGICVRPEEVSPIDASFFLLDARQGAPDNGFGVALTGAQMKQQASFTNWDFENIWTICEGQGYPRLRWEPMSCEQE
jgi:hypothetical protein